MIKEKYENVPRRFFFEYMITFINEELRACKKQSKKIKLLQKMYHIVPKTKKNENDVEFIRKEIESGNGDSSETKIDCEQLIEVYKTKNLLELVRSEKENFLIF